MTLWEIRLEPSVCFGTVEASFGEQKSRSADDWQHHPEQLVLMSDAHPYGAYRGEVFHNLTDGTVQFKLETSGMSNPMMTSSSTVHLDRQHSTQTIVLVNRADY